MSLMSKKEEKINSLQEEFSRIQDENKDLDKAFICFDENQYNNFTLKKEYG